MSGNNLWTGMAFGALTGAAIGAGIGLATSSSRRSSCCYNTPIFSYNSYNPFGFGFGGGGCFGYGRIGYGPNSTIFGPDVFTSYASPFALANVNMGALLLA